ncbi:MAG TPA: ferritin [Thermoanaerobaculia bacterium]|nr:ferritin [Thermoanaerobaculia bacterium]
MLSERMLGALNEQINAELSSAYQYLAMAAYFESINLEGSALWMKRQSREEVEHAMKIFEFIHSRDGRVALAAVGQPQADFDSPFAVWEAVLKQEQGVTARIHALYSLASEEKDYATEVMLQWFVTEQVEEEKVARGILEQVRIIGPSSSAIFFVDRHLGKEAAKGE